MEGGTNLAMRDWTLGGQSNGFYVGESYTYKSSFWCTRWNDTRSVWYGHRMGWNGFTLCGDIVITTPYPDYRGGRWTLNSSDISSTRQGVYTLPVLFLYHSLCI